MSRRCWHLLVALLLGFGSQVGRAQDPCNPIPPDPCGTVAPDQASLQRVIESGCYKQWASDSAPRLSGAVASDATAWSVHQYIKAYYSPRMACWVASNRPDGKTVPPDGSAIPEGALMIAEVYPADSQGSGSPEGWLAMLRHSAEGASPPPSADGWYWGQFLADEEKGWRGTAQQSSRAEFGFSLCDTCHASAVNNLTFANWQNTKADVPTPSFDPQFRQHTTTEFQAQVNPPPRNTLMKPLSDAAAQEFVAYYNQHAKSLQGKLSDVTKDEVYGFPFLGYDHSYLKAGKAEFATSSQCQGCHDATALLATDAGEQKGWAPPQMLFDYNPEGSSNPSTTPHDKFNASQYGEWAVSIMGLAGRDPVFHSQAETERVLHPGVDPTVIDNVCYRCHGSMGQRQFHIDEGGDPTQVPSSQQSDPRYEREKDFTHYMIYSTPDSKPGPAPPYYYEGSQPPFAKFGALAREGISCLTCHFAGPQDGSQWQDSNPQWQVFYGYPLSTQVQDGDETLQYGFSQRETPIGFDYPFTSTFLYTEESIYTPTPDINQGYKGAQADEQGVEAVAAHKQVLDLDTVQQSYLGETNLCSSCHVIIVPKIPMEYPKIRNAGQISFDTEGKATVSDDPKLPHTDIPCGPAPRGPNYPDLYDPVSDPCTEVAYEQTTFFEWASSSSFGHTTPQTSCTFCHMPSVFGMHEGVANVLTSGVGGDVGAFPRFAYQAPDEQIELTSNDGYPRHRLMGINLHVHEMFQQFPDVLGISPKKGVWRPDMPSEPARPEFGEDLLVTKETIKNLLNAEETILTHAPTTVTLSVCFPGSTSTGCQDEAYLKRVADHPDDLVFRIAVANNAGHRFPSGAGFRRGFIEFRLEDKSGKALWVSGSTDKYGAILNGADSSILPAEFPPSNAYIDPYQPFNPDLLQPHYGGNDAPYISEQNQVQIYEVRDLDEYRRLTSATTRLFTDVKDNRIPPAGWIPPVTCQEYIPLWEKARREDSQGRLSEATEAMLEELVSETEGTGTYCASQDPAACSETNGLSIAHLTRITRPAGDGFTDPDFCTANSLDVEGNLSGISGTDHVWYIIPKSDVSPAAVSRAVAIMHYQLTPPGYLAARFADGLHFSQTMREKGLEGGLLGNAVNRLLYITSRLDTNIRNRIPDQYNLPEMASSDWTMHIGFDCWERLPEDVNPSENPNVIALKKCASPTLAAGDGP